MSRGARFVLGVASLLLGLMMAVIAPDDWTRTFFHTFAGFCGLIALACFTRGRTSRFCGSVLGASVFAVALWYLIVELTAGPALSDSRAQPSIFNAMMFLLVFGMPGLLYAWRVRFGFAPEPVPLEQWFLIEFDDTQVTLRVSPPGRAPWTQSFPWSSITRVCFKDEGVEASDTLYLFTTQRPESYVVPTEGGGGQAFVAELIRRDLFPSEIAMKAFASTNGGLYCWPGEDGRDDGGR